MQRRNFLQSSLTLIAATGVVLPVISQAITKQKKGFTVKALKARTKEKIIYGNTPLDFKLLGSDTEDRLSVFISTNNMKGFGPPLHVHHNFDEFFCVLEGKFLFQLGDEMLALEKGDSIFIPRNNKHCFDNTGDVPGTLLVGITPSKGMENYFADMGKLLNGQGMPDMKAMQALYKTYNSEILGPPMK